VALSLQCKEKVNCTLVQALRLCRGRTVHRGSRGIALLFHDYSTRRGWGVSVTPRQLFTPGKTRYPLWRRLGGPQGRSGQVRKISPPTGIRSPDLPASSQSLYRLRYPAHFVIMCRLFNNTEGNNMVTSLVCSDDSVFLADGRCRRFVFFSTLWD
jgi:hypothetical protein